MAVRGDLGRAQAWLTLRPRRWASVLWWLKLAFGLGMIAAALAEYVTGAGHLLVSGAATRGNAVTVLTYGTPFLWIVLVPDGGSAAGFEARFGRLLLCLVAVMQALGVPPLPMKHGWGGWLQLPVPTPEQQLNGTPTAVHALFCRRVGHKLS